eukprot:956802-Pelagomonas_calceolata.AAC.1
MRASRSWACSWVARSVWFSSLARCSIFCMQYAEQPWAIIAHVHAVGTHEHYKCPAGPRSHTHSQNAIALYTPSAIDALPKTHQVSYALSKSRAAAMQDFAGSNKGNRIKGEIWRGVCKPLQEVVYLHICFIECRLSIRFGPGNMLALFKPQPKAKMQDVMKGTSSAHVGL